MGFRFWGLGFRVWGLGFRVWGFGFGVWGFGCVGFWVLQLYGLRVQNFTLFRTPEPETLNPKPLTLNP